jgi:hypothetical protein
MINLRERMTVNKVKYLSNLGASCPIRNLKNRHFVVTGIRLMSR